MDQKGVIRYSRRGVPDAKVVDEVVNRLVNEAEGQNGGTLEQAIQTAASMKGYAFQINEGRSKAPLSGKYEKGKPVFFMADRIEFYRKGEVLVYKQGDDWRRSKTGTLSDPLRVLGAGAKVRAANLPHNELPDL
jgi:hypothetical protein